MLVRDLIELLEDYDADMEIHFEYNYGDHWRTHVAPKVSTVAEGQVVWSEYHRMPKVVDGCDEDDADKLQTVVIIG